MSKLNELINSSAWQLLWFNNPDIDVVITDKKAENRIRQLCMEATLELKKGLLNDSVLTNMLGYYVFYMQNGKYKQLVNHINKMCGLSIDMDVSVLKLTTDNYVYIIAKHINCPIKHLSDSPSAQSFVQQDDYYYMRTNKSPSLLQEDEEFSLIRELYE